jgi:HEAT repeat protein
MFARRVLFFGIMAGLLFVACRKGTPTTCEGWAKLLKSPARSRDAIKNLGDLGTNCKAQVKDLEAIFDQSPFKEEILQTIRVIRAPEESVSILTKALNVPHTAVLAAAVAEELPTEKLKQPLLEILTTDKALQARENALKALVAIEKGDMKAHEDLLIKLLRTDPDVHGIGVNALAAKLLGDMQSVKATNDLIVAMFLRSQRGGQVYTPVRKALAKIGKPAVAPLVAIATGKEEGFEGLFKDLRETAKKEGVYEWQWQDGPEVVQVLSDIADKDAAPALAESIGKPLNPPVGVDDRVLRLWQVAQQNRITMCMMGLWKVGDASLIDKLKAVIMNPDNDAKQRLDTATATALLPDFVGVSAVLDVFRKSKDSRFRAPLVKPISLGLDWAHLKEWEALVASEQSEVVKERLSGDSPEAKEYIETVKVLKDCAEGDTDCLVGKLKNGGMFERVKAAILLGSMQKGDKRKALAALVEVYPTVDVTNVDLRRFILLSIYRLGDKNTVPDLQRLLKADQDRKGAGYWVDEIETLIPAMARKG